MQRKKVYYEEKILEYDFGKELYNKFKKENAHFTLIQSHNNIEELRKRENKDFVEMKSYIILGIRKTHKYTENKKVSDFLVPFTSSGCSAMCLYCYLVCNYNKCSYFRYFVNREQMLEKIIKHTNKFPKEFVYEIGSNSDLVLENVVTNNLPYVINNFCENSKKGKLTFPTKFSNIDSILDCNHNGRIIVRMSVNPNEIISTYELKTSNLENRIKAINKLCEADYKVGILIAPVIMVQNYKGIYHELIKYMYENLTPKAKKQIFFEVIFMTYSFVHRKINEEAFPHIDDLYNEEMMKGRERGKYCYRDDIREEGKMFIRSLLDEYFKNNKIIYMV